MGFRSPLGFEASTLMTTGKDSAAEASEATARMDKHIENGFWVTIGYRGLPEVTVRLPWVVAGLPLMDVKVPRGWGFSESKTGRRRPERLRKSLIIKGPFGPPPPFSSGFVRI